MNANGTQAGETTRERILRAAVRKFSTQSYQATGLREIAADAGVDVAWVHRSFGSKERLFVESVKSTLDRQIRVATGDRSPVDAMIEDVLRPREEGEVKPVDIIIRSVSSPEVSRVLKELATTGFVRPLAEMSPHRSELRAALVLALLAGVGIMRNVIGITALLEAETAEISSLIGRAIGAIDGTSAEG